jgi:hypothetical protein
MNNFLEKECKTRDFRFPINYTNIELGGIPELVVKQLIPADHWVAYYTDQNNQDDMLTCKLPLLGFGLLANGEVIPLVIDKHGVIGNPCEEKGFKKILRLY